MVLGLLTALALFAFRRYPYVTVGWFWYLLTLAPVSGIVPVGCHSMADRYTYIPLIGIFIIAAWGIPGEWTANWPVRSHAGWRQRKLIS
jgi:hypothetical protein